ncbi:MAG: Crp/Fnr family transcriptional regulator [Acidobacteriia bacterium]|nr:Crp/Fnr family transcriptional regulator [Terriglobia bacterium]
MLAKAEEILRRIPLFAGITEGETRALAARMSAKRYIVASGKVRIFKMSPSGREQILSLEGAGSTIAELPVFDGGNYPASALAAEDAEILFISRKEFQAFCLEHPAMALKVIAVVGGRLRRLVGIIEELSFTTVRQRLIALLVRLAQEKGPAGKQGIRIELGASHQELAAELGTVRELVSRNLGRLQAEGLIEVEGREIVVKDLAGLKSEQGAGE